MACRSTQQGLHVITRGKRAENPRVPQAKDKQADCMVSQVCCSGCVEVAPHSTGAVLVMETNHRKEGRQSSSTHVPGD